MTAYTIEYTPTEEKAMQFIAVSVDEWLQNAAHERARIAIDDIVQFTVRRCLENNMQIPATKEEIVDLAYSEGWIKTAAQSAAENTITG